MILTKKTCEEYIELLASSDSVPGGGGASAVVGAMGVALASMVASLTVGKKKYASVEEEIIGLKNKCSILQTKLIELAHKDAVGFLPLSMAYSLPSGTDDEKKEKKEIMEHALKVACEAPFEMMEKCCEAIDIHSRMEEIGTAIAISDVGAGVLFCGSSLKAASLNIFINTKSMVDRGYANTLNDKVNMMLDKYTEKADEIYIKVRERFI